jgi:hypothetical protein
MATITIQKKLADKDDLIVISKKELGKLRAHVGKRKTVSERDILRWSREAKKLRRSGKLQKLG